MIVSLLFLQASQLVLPEAGTLPALPENLHWLPVARETVAATTGPTVGALCGGLLPCSPAFCVVLRGGCSPSALVSGPLLDVSRAYPGLGLRWGPSPQAFLFPHPILDTLSSGENILSATGPFNLMETLFWSLECRGTFPFLVVVSQHGPPPPCRRAGVGGQGELVPFISVGPSQPSWCRSRSGLSLGWGFQTPPLVNAPPPTPAPCVLWVGLARALGLLSNGLGF